MALWAEKNHIGLLNYFQLNNHSSSKFITIIFLDFAIYVQHVLTHRVQFLWRLHRVHHGDRDLDVTSALRFHPLEIFISIIYKIFLIILFGLPSLSVLIFEVLLNLMAMFNHANIHIPHKLEKYLRLLIVTPQMHLIHHSIHRKEHDTNYGFNLSCWDFIFKTYKKSFDGKVIIGLGDLRELYHNKLTNLLMQPFRQWK